MPDLPNYLRLVTASNKEVPDAGNKSSEGPRLIQRKAVQLQLPHLDTLTFVLVFVGNFRGLSDFSKYVGALKPKWIFDVRVIPRLDVLGGTRSHVFSVFRAQGVNYVDLLGQLGVQSEGSARAKPAVWGKELARVVDASPNFKGIVLLLFDNPELLKSAALTLPLSLEAAMKRPVAVETYS